MLLPLAPRRFLRTDSGGPAAPAAASCGCCMVAADSSSATMRWWLMTTTTSIDRAACRMHVRARKKGSTHIDEKTVRDAALNQSIHRARRQQACRDAMRGINACVRSQQALAS